MIKEKLTAIIRFGDIIQAIIVLLIFKLKVLSYNCFFFLIFKKLAAQFSKVKLIFIFEHVINKRPYFIMTMYSKHPLYLED